MSFPLFRIALMSCLVVVLAGCGGRQASNIEAQNNAQARIETAQHKSQVRADVQKLNQQIALAASRAGSTKGAVEDYRLGAGDLVEIAVFQVEELNLKKRINGRGSVILPLLGEVNIGGKTPQDAEQILASRLKEYLRNPQVSVFVSEYRSQQISVLGAVQKPSVYNVERPHTVVEVISLAGGLTENAGGKVYVQGTFPHPETGKPEPQNIIINLRELLLGTRPEINMLLRGGDSVSIPEGGSIFVEGAVIKTGSYPIKGEVTVAKAVILAGGAKYEADENQIQVIRQAEEKPEIIQVDLAAVRTNTAKDIVLEDGDVVVVPASGVRSGLVGFWKGVTSIFNVGIGIGGTITPW